MQLEPFITPSIFQKVNDSKVIDEYTYGQKFGSAAASQRLQPHWDQFITAKSFDLIKAAGLNTVRIPIVSREPSSTSSALKMHLPRAIGPSRA